MLQKEGKQDSRFLYHAGGWGQLSRVAVDDGSVSDEQVLDWLIESGLWEQPEVNPATDINAAISLLNSRPDNKLLLYKEGKDWCVGWMNYNRLDWLSGSSSLARAICFYFLRFPEIDRVLNNLPYRGWSTRYAKNHD